MRARDPDDVDVLALALQSACPVWTNDNDFEDVGVEWHTTAELLKLLEITSRWRNVDAKCPQVLCQNCVRWALRPRSNSVICGDTLMCISVAGSR